jgi:4'-phosphopantetheinyl transferase EntD
VLDRIVPSAVATVETRADLLTRGLFPEEQQGLGRPDAPRWREFVTGRVCARQALERLGIEPMAIRRGSRGQPLWPAGVVGSITHCRGYRACAIAKSADVAALGIDADLDAPLPCGALERVASPRELRCAAGQAISVWVDRLLFCAKEAVYKALFPLSGRSLDFDDVEVLVDWDGGFRAAFRAPGPTVQGKRLSQLNGRWAVCDGVLATAVVLAATR